MTELVELNLMQLVKHTGLPAEVLESLMEDYDVIDARRISHREYERFLENNIATYNRRAKKMLRQMYTVRDLLTDSTIIFYEVGDGLVGYYSMGKKRDLGFKTPF